MPDNVRQQFGGKEKDYETGLNYFDARYYASEKGRFVSVDPLDPVLGRQGASNREEAESQFRAYLGQPQRWNRYAYCLNNPLRYIDPDGFDPLVVNLNIIFDKNKYDKKQQQEFIDSYVAQAKKDFGKIEIQFNVTVSEGTASDTANHNTHAITSGAVSGAVNVFVTPGSVGPAPEVTHHSRGEIWISTGGATNTENSNNLSHGLVHVFGIAPGVNGYPSVDNSSDNRWMLLAEHIGRQLVGNDAETAAQNMQNYLQRGYAIGVPPSAAANLPAGVGQSVVASSYDKEINILREGARKYLHK